MGGQPAETVLGKQVHGWPEERWLDVRQYQGKLGEITKARLDMCEKAGFDGVEADLVDGYKSTSVA